MAGLYGHARHESKPGQWLFICLCKEIVATEAFDWCRENIGPKGKEWEIGPWDDILIYSQEHAFAFKMRWC